LQQAFQEGMVYELMTETFEAAVEYLGNLIFGLLGSGTFWSGIWDIMVGEFITKWAVIAKLFMNLGVVLTAALTTAFQTVFEWVGKIPKVGKMLGLEGYKAQTFGANYAEGRENAKGANKMIDGWLGVGAGRFASGSDKMNKAWAEASANSGGPAQDRLAATIKKLKGDIDWEHSPKDKDKEKKALATVPLAKMEFTSLEKMGFVMSGLGNFDFASRTANATEKMARKMGAFIEAAGGGDTEPVHEAT
jgi:hypothetical protein